MRNTVRHSSLLAVVAAGALIGSASAATLAQAPSNDDRGAAKVLGALPLSVDGTTAGSTLERNEAPACSGATSGSVWYELTAPAKGRIVVRLDASGKLDAVLDVFQRTRSQVVKLYSQNACDATDKNGEAAVRFDADAKGSTYLVRVSERAGSASGDFRLDAFVPQAFPSVPGPDLPSNGVGRKIDRLSNTADAWSAMLQEGVTYRVNLAHAIASCPSLEIYGPGNGFSDEASVTRACGGYVLLTPGPGRGGRWNFLIQADDGIRGPQTYRLQVAPVRPDDMTPGLRVANGTWTAGKLEGGIIDKVDVYRFDVLSRSAATLRLHASQKSGFDLLLVSTRGRTISCACDGVGNESIRRTLRRGRYYVLVKARHRARGDYRLLRITRRITSIRISVNGAGRARVGHGKAVKLGVRLRPGVGGPVSIVIDRFDPLSGWHFRTLLRATIHGGHASVSYTPPVIGTWRAYAVFRGTRTAAPSDSTHVRWRVTEPLAK